MEKNNSVLSKLWEMRHRSVNECLEAIRQQPDLQFLLTSAGIWFFIRFLIGITITVNVLYFVYRVFQLVLA